jgi:nucleoside phosphorylase
MDISQTASNAKNPLVSGIGFDSEGDEQLQGDIVLMSVSGFYTTQLTHSGTARTDHGRHFISPLKCNPSPPRDRDDFEILIICSLPLEADAVEALFDKRWDANGDIYSKALGDQNAYSTGMIGRHNIVLAHMPDIGKVTAASVAANCRSSFGGIKLALVVGVCGGVPSNEDREEILLGDVIISDGIIQYDRGRQYPDKFVRKDTLMDNLGRPNMEIRALLSKLKGRYGRKILQEKMCEHLSTLSKKLATTFPGVAEDKLFESNYRHKHQIPSSCATCNACKQQNDPVCDAAIKSTCEQLHCDEEKLVPRHRLFQIQADAVSDQRSSIRRPVVHFGLIASGDTVMKSGEHRDQISTQEKAIAFEMEGAGVWDHFPCLIIKGVSDYADNHKSMKWQNYAAGTAAACMKAFLENWTVAGSHGST